MSEHQKSLQNGCCNQVNEISPALEKQSYIDDGEKSKRGKFEWSKFDR